MGLKGVVFDLDDVVYLQREYVRSGFMAVAKSLSEDGAEEVFDLLWTMLGQEGELDLFSRLLEELPELKGDHDAEGLAEIYWTHEPTIEVLPEVRELVTGLQAKGVKCGLVADGDADVQERKVQALGADDLFDAVLVTHQFDTEPWKLSSLSLDITAHAMDLLNERLVYVGDNPVKDFLGARKLGWRTILLEQPGQLRDTDAETRVEPHFTAQGVPELGQLLERLSREA